MKIKICPCGDDFANNNGRAKWCIDCKANILRKNSKSRLWEISRKTASHS
jgi:hypothetical protein